MLFMLWFEQASIIVTFNFCKLNNLINHFHKIIQLVIHELAFFFEGPRKTLDILDTFFNVLKIFGVICLF